MDFPTKSKYWKLIPTGNADKTAQIIATTQGLGVMIGLPKIPGNGLFLNFLKNKTQTEIELYKPLATAIYPCTKAKYFATHEQYDWYVTHSGLTSTGIDVTVLSPF